MYVYIYIYITYIHTYDIIINVHKYVCICIYIYAQEPQALRFASDRLKDNPELSEAPHSSVLHVMLLYDVIVYDCDYVYIYICIHAYIHTHIK